MDKISAKLCEACGKNKVRTLCYECREAYCQDCSDCHLRFKATRDHSLVELHPRYEKRKCQNTSRSSEEAESSSDFLPSQEEAECDEETELSSDFLESLTMTENTVLYRAQVAVEGSSKGNDELENADNTKPKSSENVPGTMDRDGKEVGTKAEVASYFNEDNIMKQNTCLEPTKRIALDSKVGQFSVRRTHDKVQSDIRGIVVIYEKIIIADKSNKTLQLFDMDGTYISSIDSRQCVRGITIVSDDSFATCGEDKTIHLWKLRDENIVAEDISYKVDRNSDGIHYNGTYYCLLHRYDNAVTVLDTKGKGNTEIGIIEAFGKKIQLGWDIYMDSKTHNIYAPCIGKHDGILCVSLEGESLWFTPLKGQPWGITEIHGVICVSDAVAHCVHLLSKTGQYKEKMLHKESMIDQLGLIHYDNRNKRLLFNLLHSDVIRVVSIKIE